MVSPDQFIEHGDARLRFRSAGSGPAVLLIHGWALDLEMWDSQFAALAHAYRVIAFDRRGFGYSTGQPSIADDVRDVLFLLDTLDVQSAAIVGMSQGARVALRFALQSPQRASCLVLDGPPPETSSAHGLSAEVPMTTYRRLARNQGMDAFRQQWIQHPLMHLQTDDTDVQASLLRIIGRYPGHDLLGLESPLSLLGDRLDAIAAPALFINGEHDSAIRFAASAAMRRLLPNTRAEIVPAAGHLPNLDNPAAYNQLLGEFLRIYGVPGVTAGPTTTTQH
ncbi:MAG TPA: alpha/beta hydrolase [Steroidobacteraceae bacterium]